jgi:hypothetical protein
MLSYPPFSDTISLSFILLLEFKKHFKKCGEKIVKSIDLFHQELKGFTQIWLRRL